MEDNMNAANNGSLSADEARKEKRRMYTKAWREKNSDRYRTYMREYMRKRRANPETKSNSDQDPDTQPPQHLEQEPRS